MRNPLDQYDGNTLIYNQEIADNREYCEYCRCEIHNSQRYCEDCKFESK